MEILYEDQELIVCYKEAGVATQTKRMSEKDMESILKSHLYQNSKEKQEPYLGIVHRLDQPVEGLLVFAKTPFAAKGLSEQVAKRQMGKYYLAIVEPALTKEEGMLEDYLLKDGRLNISKVVEKGTKNAKRAQLRYQVRDSKENKSLVQIELITGRHHQIRAQMANAGHPLCGDWKYKIQEVGGKGKYPTDKSVIGLCSYCLEFIHPKTKKEMKFEVVPRGVTFKDLKW